MQDTQNNPILLSTGKVSSRADVDQPEQVQRKKTKVINDHSRKPGLGGRTEKNWHWLVSRRKKLRGDL